MIARAIVVFPQPDYPTIPIASPAWTSRLTSSTARTTALSSVRKLTLRWLTRSSGSATASRLAQALMVQAGAAAAGSDGFQLDVGHAALGTGEPAARVKRAS